MRKTRTHIVELDGIYYQAAGDRLRQIDDLREVKGDIWLATDFKEGMSRVMTVEGPAKYAELLVRRKLQESGEFEEAVEIISHWKRKRGKNATDIFFTAVPARLARFYLEEMHERDGLCLVYGMYGMMWDQLRRLRSKTAVAVVLRHDRFAEVLVASKDRIYFANRCVAFDTEKEQLDALWATIQSDIEAVETEQRVQVGRIMRLNWLGAGDVPDWPREWSDRLFDVTPEILQAEDEAHRVSWTRVLKKSSALQSVSPWQQKLLHYAQTWSPFVNAGLALAAGLLLMAMVAYRQAANDLSEQVAQVRNQIGKVQLSMPKETLGDQFDALLEFVGQLDRYHHAPSYQQIIDDLTLSPMKVLDLERLKVEFATDRLRLELHGDIEAPFDRAHEGWQGFLRHLNALGYVLEESRFETQISKSQVMLKLTRPLI